jgi:hypothetical protein
MNLKRGSNDLISLIYPSSLKQLKYFTLYIFIFIGRNCAFPAEQGSTDLRLIRPRKLAGGDPQLTAFSALDPKKNCVIYEICGSLLFFLCALLG